MNIGKKIAEKRRAKNLTQEQLAEMMNVTRQTVSRWESDLAYPEMEKVVALASILDVSCDYLLREDCQKSEAVNQPWKTGGVTRLLRQMGDKKRSGTSCTD